MKAILITLILIGNSMFATAAAATPTEKIWSFQYKVNKSQTFKIQAQASTFEQAFKTAAKDCYKQLTQGKYPGEEKGLEIIDICANPKS